MRPVIIDCSSGVYEALALATAVGKGLDIRAVTVNGVFETKKKAAEDVSGLCRELGISAPVVMGAWEPVIAHIRPLVDRYPRLPEGFVKPGSVKSGYAWDEIYHQAEIAEGKLTVVCLGPVTNVAIALFKYPELKDMLEEVIFFGGALDWGNVSQTAEVNAYADPHALDALSKSGIPTTMVPWSVTCGAGVSRETVRGELTGKLVDMLASREKLLLEKDLVLNHAMAVLYAAGAEGFETKKHIIRVETDSSICMGRTCANLMYSLKKDPPNMNVVRRICTDGLQWNQGL